MGRLIEPLERRPLIAAALGGVLIAIALSIGVPAYAELKRYPTEPTPLRVERAASEHSAYNWVRIEQPHWSCDELIQSDGNTYAALVGAEDSRLLAVIDHRVACSDLPTSVEGVVAPVSPMVIQRLAMSGSSVRSSDGLDPVMLCTFCGPATERASLLRGGVLALVGLSLYPFVLLLKRRRERSA